MFRALAIYFLIAWAALANGGTLSGVNFPTNTSFVASGIAGIPRHIEDGIYVYSCQVGDAFIITKYATSGATVASINTKTITGDNSQDTADWIVITSTGTYLVATHKSSTGRDGEIWRSKTATFANSADNWEKVLNLYGTSPFVYSGYVWQQGLAICTVAGVSYVAVGAYDNTDGSGTSPAVWISEDDGQTFTAQFWMARIEDAGNKHIHAVAFDESSAPPRVWIAYGDNGNRGISYLVKVGNAWNVSEITPDTVIDAGSAALRNYQATAILPLGNNVYFGGDSGPNDCIHGVSKATVYATPTWNAANFTFYFTNDYLRGEVDFIAYRPVNVGGGVAYMPFIDETQAYGFDANRELLIMATGDSGAHWFPAYYASYYEGGPYAWYGLVGPDSQGYVYMDGQRKFKVIQWRKCL